MPSKLIDSYKAINPQQVNDLFKNMMAQNQRRLHIKLVSQNHVSKDEDDAEAEGIGGPEFKEENEKANILNKSYYNKLNMKTTIIDNMG